MVPGRDEALALIARLAVWRQPTCPRVLDLGCGTGEASAAVLALAPEASLAMVDFSDEMLQRAAARFAGDARASSSASAGRRPRSSSASARWTSGWATSPGRSGPCETS
jgi:trans-aconitate methyltransferase